MYGLHAPKLKQPKPKQRKPYRKQKRRHARKGLNAGKPQPRYKVGNCNVVCNLCSIAYHNTKVVTCHTCYTGFGNVQHLCNQCITAYQSKGYTVTRL